MNKFFFILAMLFSFCLPALAQSPTNYYVRLHGGSRYTAQNRPEGQCDGQADVDYSGVGINQHCAFGDVRFLWTDGQYTNSTSGVFPAWGWIGKGGDIYTIRGGPWRVGQSGPNSGDSFGLNGDPFGAGAPAPPAGTASQHTQVRGENFANCSTQANATQLFGGYGVFQVLSLGSTSFVDVECIDFTRHSQCIKFGSPASPAGCNTGWPIDDYASNGLSTNTGTHDILLQDVWIHGFTSRGIIGPIGGIVTALRVDISTNGGGGWDFDDGNATASVNGVLNAEALTIEFSGCNQAYPGTGAASCYSQSTGGYGDGLGTPGGTCISFHLNNVIFRYNTQDGFDGLHNDAGLCPSSITHTKSYGNNGQQFKWGPALSPMVFTNNLAVAGCHRLSAPLTGQPSAYNANLQDFCRAGDTITFSLGNHGSTTIDHNTVISYSPTVFDIECGADGCADSTVTMSNNIVLGYDNPATYPIGGKPGGPGAIYFSAVPTNVIRTNNDFFGTRDFSPADTEQALDPKFIGEPMIFTQESDLDIFTDFPVLSSGSPLSGLGASATGNGAGQITPIVTWSNPASIVQGTTLSSAQLNATSSVPGTFAYNPGVGTILSSGTSTLLVSFTPTDTAHYTNATGSAQIVVTPPIVILPPPPPPPPPAGCPSGQAPVTITLGASSYSVCAFTQ